MNSSLKDHHKSFLIRPSMLISIRTHAMRCAMHYDTVEYDATDSDKDSDNDSECDDGCNAMAPRLFYIDEVPPRTTFFAPSYEF